MSTNLVRLSTLGTITFCGAFSARMGPQYSILASLVASMCLTTLSLARTGTFGKASTRGCRPK
ncbi:Uncharacterised protein [Vibrio cholerae]|nr:Uncharacterised protein [Vibrio cholerae]